MHPTAHARENPDKPALIEAESGAVLTYGELDRDWQRAAQAYRSMGLKRGDAIAILMDNSPAFFIAAWAAQMSGLYYVGVSTRLTGPEVAYLLSDSGAKLLIHSERLRDIAEAAVAEAGKGVRALSSGKDGEFEAMIADMPATWIDDPAPGRDMLYSSGTTGRPKGIRFDLPEGDVEQDMAITGLARSLYGFDKDTVYLCPAPLYHSAPLRFSLSTQQIGGTVVLMRKFDAELALKLIEQYRITVAQWVPTHFVRLLALPEDVRQRYDLSSLKCVFHAAAPCPREVKQQMMDWWGPIIHEYYASTETIGLCSVTPREWLERPGTVGTAKLGELHICDENGEELPAGEVGHVYFANGIPLKYHNDPEKTREAHNDRGWATVGDIGKVDEEGYLWLTDRASFMIISGGVNIYPQEIEDRLIEHPEVADAAVIGAPDPEMGERVVAVVQPVDAKVDRDALRERLLASLKDRLSFNKTPKQIDFRDTLPREENGKLMKRLLRDEYRALAEQGVE